MLCLVALRTGKSRVCGSKRLNFSIIVIGPKIQTEYEELIYIYILMFGALYPWYNITQWRTVRTQCVQTLSPIAKENGTSISTFFPWQTNIAYSFDWLIFIMHILYFLRGIVIETFGGYWWSRYTLAKHWQTLVVLAGRQPSCLRQSCMVGESI